MLVKAFVLSKLDYCNILFCNLSKNQLKPLQTVLNKSIQFAFALGKRDSVTHFLKTAHILPVHYRVMFKSCVMVYKVLYGTGPHYLQDIVQVQPLSSAVLSFYEILRWLVTAYKLWYYKLSANRNGEKLEYITIEHQKRGDNSAIQKELKDLLFSISFWKRIIAFSKWQFIKRMYYWIFIDLHIVYGSRLGTVGSFSH